MVDWIEKELNKKIANKIEKINKDFYELGKEFKLLKEKNLLDLKKIEKQYFLNRVSIKKYIELASFIDENKITNYPKIGIKKLELLKKIEEKEKLQELLKNIDNYSTEDIKKLIKDYKNKRLIKKCFNLNEIDNQRLLKIKEHFEKEIGNKITNSQLLSYMIDYIYISEKLE